jgi:hypothetical protein
MIEDKVSFADLEDKLKLKSSKKDFEMILR